MQTTNESRSSSPAVTKVLIVDDHPAIHQALRTIINDEEDMAVAGAVRSRSEALDFIDEHAPSVAVVDISLEDSYGVRLIRDIADRAPDVTIVVFSMFDEYVYAQRAISAGAKAYIMKRDAPSKIISAIRRALDGNIHVSNQLASRIVDSLAQESNGTRDPFDQLTDREFAVFNLLGQGYNLSQIRDQLNISRRTVRSCQRQLRKKFGLDNTRELLELATEWFQYYSNEAAGSKSLKVCCS